VKPDDRVSERDVADAVKAVLAGNRNAFALIVERFQDSVMTMAMALRRNRQGAEELTQDVFVRAYERLASFDATRPMKPWLARITCRLAQDAWQNQLMEARRQREARDRREGSGSESGPLESLIADERARMLWRAMEALPLAEKRAAILYYREGLTVQEVAEVTEVSTGTVKALLFRARDHLRIILNGHDEPSGEGQSHDM
jgi:RNA polymerase sigma-70 factor (ECF subfamily)